MSAHMDKKTKKSSSLVVCVSAAILLPLLFAASPLRADDIYFKSGYSSTGVVINETEDSITFRTEMGLFTVDKKKVDFVDKDAEDENRALRRKWREKEIRRKEARRAQQEEQTRFREEQLAKGLVEFEGNWIPPERRDEILSLRRRAYEHRRDFEARQKAKGLVQFQHIWVSPEAATELSNMERQINDLLDQIEKDEEMVESFRAAMMNVNSIEEADRFSKRIEEVNTWIAEKNKQLDELFDKADEIESSSAKYVTPDEFIGVLPAPGENEEE